MTDNSAPTVFRGHTITRTDKLSVDNYPLYKIEGKYGKKAKKKPYLTNMTTAKKWISIWMEDEKDKKQQAKWAKEDAKNAKT